MIRVLSVDCAMRRTGWAVMDSEGEVRPVWGLYHTQDWNKENCDRELHRWRQWLFDMHREHGFTHVAVEEVFVDNRNGGKNFNYSGTQFQMMATGILFQWCFEFGIETFNANIDRWRARFLGINRLPKDFERDKTYWKKLALKVAAQRNWFCTEHDEAEACGIADFTLAALSKPYRLRTEKYLAKQHQDFDLKTGAHA